MFPFKGKRSDFLDERNYALAFRNVFKHLLREDDWRVVEHLLHILSGQSQIELIDDVEALAITTYHYSIRSMTNPLVDCRLRFWFFDAVRKVNDQCLIWHPACDT
ncbi:unnamed protein product, partial [Nesidiocoris tenuis]